VKTLTTRMAQYELDTVYTMFSKAMDKYFRTLEMKKGQAAEAWTKRTGDVGSKKAMARCEVKITRTYFLAAKHNYEKTLAMCEVEAANAYDRRYHGTTNS